MRHEDNWRKNNLGRGNSKGKDWARAWLSWFKIVKEASVSEAQWARGIVAKDRETILMAFPLV